MYCLESHVLLRGRLSVPRPADIDVDIPLAYVQLLNVTHCCVTAGPF